MQLTKTTQFLVGHSHKLYITLQSNSSLNIKLVNTQNNKIFTRTLDEDSIELLSVRQWLDGCSQIYQKLSKCSDISILYEGSIKIILSKKQQYGNQIIDKAAELLIDLTQKDIYHDQESTWKIKINKIQEQLAKLNKDLSKTVQMHQKQIEYLNRQNSKKIEYLLSYLNYIESIVKPCHFTTHQINMHSNKYPKYINHNDLKIEKQQIINNNPSCKVIKWIMIGQSLNLNQPTYLVIKINKINWMGVGICKMKHLIDRKLQGLNGRSDHGCHIIQNYGWSHSHNQPQYDYKQIEFSYEEGQVITIKFDAQKKYLKITNEYSLRDFTLPLITVPNHQFLDLHFCIACSGQADFEIMEQL